MPARSGLPLRVLHLARQLAASRPVELAALSNEPVPDCDEQFELRHLPAESGRLAMRRR